MNFRLDNIKQYAARVLGRSNAVPNTAIMHPAREWNIGIIATTLLAVVVSLGAWIAYTYYGTISLDTKTAATEVFNYKRSDALAALEMFSARKAAHQTLMGQAPKPEPVIEIVPEEELSTEALIEAGLVGTDGQILPQPPQGSSAEESETPPTLDISE